MRLTWRRERLALRHAFATAQGPATSEKEVLVVELEHRGLVGRGEVTPSRLYGQTLESAEAALARIGAHLGDDPLAIEPAVQRLLAHFDDQRAAVAGVDAALHDWVGKHLGLPVWRLLGLDRPRVRTSFTLGLAPVDEMRRKVDEALTAGFDVLKVKVGGPDDEAVLAAIRSVFDGPLLVDANEAWSAQEAPDRVRALARWRPALIEQPVGRNERVALARLRELGVAPIFVDESCQRAGDVPRLAGCIDGVNVKLSKCGGIREALRMIAVARGLGMSVMLGCFVGSSLGIAPALVLASLADWADLDGHLLLAGDPFTGIVRQGSLLSLSDEPGLGVRPA